MPTPIFDEIKNWANGVVTSTAADQLPVDAIPRGWNTMLTKIGSQAAQVSKRKGPSTLNRTAITGSPRILAGFQFKKKNGSKYELLVSDNGRLDILNSDSSLTNVSTALTAGTHYPDFAVANDLCFIVTDVDQKKFDGTNLQAFGITRPVAPTAAAAAGGAMATGVWDVGLAYFNSATGHESSLSDFTTVTLTAGNQKINVSWLAPADAQVTHVRVYVRQQSAGSNAYRAIAGATPAPDATWGGYVPATLATVLDISAVQYGAFTLLAPTTTENNPPPSGAQYPCWHGSRIFLADAGNIYWSKVKTNTPYPEAFDPLNAEPINPNDGDQIVGLVSAHGKLFIFKKYSVWTVTGADPNSWSVDLLCRDFGLSSSRSIVYVEGLLYWWSGALGPVVHDGSSLPISMGKQLLADTLGADTLNLTGLTSINASYDEINQTIIWAVPETGQTRNTRLIPFNYRLKRFAADAWTPFDVSAIWQIEDSTLLRQVHVGGYGGQVFKWWAAGVDGVAAGTLSGTVTSSTSSVMTCSGATFDTTGAGLIERYLYIISADRRDCQRRRITANTATTITVTPNFSTTPNNTNTFVVGGIDFELDTPWMNGPSGFQKKRFNFILAEVNSQDAGAILDVDIFTNYDVTAPKKTRLMTLVTDGGIYDTSLYDAAKFAGGSLTYGKARVGLAGRAWRARFRNVQPNVDLSFYRIAMQSMGGGLKR